MASKEPGSPRPGHPRAGKQAALAEFGQRALTAMSLSTLLDDAVGLVARIVQADCCHALELIPDTRTLFLRAGTGWQEGVVGRATVELETEETTKRRRIIGELGNEGSLGRSHSSLLAHHGIRKGAAVEIGGKERAFGILGAYRKETRDFSADDISFLRSIANMLGAAIERIGAEEALRSSEKRYRLLAENAQDLIYRYQIVPQPGFEYVSPAATLLTGYRPEDFYLDPDLGYKLVHPEDLLLLQAAQLSPSSSPGRFTLRWMRKDGIPLWVEIRNVPIYDDQGTLVSIEGIARDITGQKHAEEALRRSQARLAEAQRIARLGSWELELETGEVRWSDELYRILGVPPEAFGGAWDDLAKWIHPADRDSFRKSFEEALWSRKTFQIDHRVLRPDGCTRTVNHRVAVVSDRSGKAVRAVGTVQDITERKNEEGQLGRLHELEAVDLNSLIGELQGALRTLLGESIQMMTVLDPQLKRIHSVPAQLRDLILDLAARASSRMRPGGKLTIATANTDLDEASARSRSLKPGPYVLISITADGPGASVMRQSEEEAGPGLERAHAIISQSGAKIEARTEPGMGSIHDVYLPVR